MTFESDEEKRKSLSQFVETKIVDRKVAFSYYFDQFNGSDLTKALDLWDQLAENEKSINFQNQESVGLDYVSVLFENNVLRLLLTKLVSGELTLKGDSK